MFVGQARLPVERTGEILDPGHSSVVRLNCKPRLRPETPWTGPCEQYQSIPIGREEGKGASADKRRGDLVRRRWGCDETDDSRRGVGVVARLLDRPMVTAAVRRDDQGRAKK